MMLVPGLQPSAHISTKRKKESLVLMPKIWQRQGSLEQLYLKLYPLILGGFGLFKEFTNHWQIHAVSIETQGLAPTQLWS